MKEIDVITAELNNSKKIEQSSMMLNNMLSNQRSPFNRTRLGYNPNLMLYKTKEKPRSYVMVLINPIEGNENTNKANPYQKIQVFLT